MNEPFVMKAVVSIAILALGVWLLIWDRKARALEAERSSLAADLMDMPNVSEDSDFERKD